jgi:hypothetical protein
LKQIKATEKMVPRFLGQYNNRLSGDYHRKRLAKEKAKTQAPDQEVIQIAELVTNPFQTEVGSGGGAELHLGPSAVLKISSHIEEDLLHKILRAVIACGRT